MNQKLFGILKSEKGQGLAEYGLIIALIAVVAIVAITFLGESVRDKFQFVGETIEAAD